MDYAARIRAARTLMADRGLDAMLLSLGADLPYFTGYSAMPLERLTMFVLPVAGPAALVVPELEAPRVVEKPDVFEVRPWGETENPVRMVADLVSGARRVAIGDQTWSTFLLQLQEHLSQAVFVQASSLTAELRMHKDAAEIDLLRRAGAAADRVAVRLADVRFSGKTERELSRTIADMLLEEGHERVDFAIVGSGPNGASPHHEGSDRVIGIGDAVVCDFGGVLGGYYSDTTRMFVVGEAPEGFAEPFAVLRRAQAAAVEAVRTGVTAESIDAVARGVITDGGYGEFFIHRTGHGIGLDVHEHPYIVEGNDTVLAPGITFSVEPGIYLPGRFGMRIEDIVTVTDDGVERLNRSSRDLVTVR
ncbi:MAG: aminopeptidase P family protein [Actinobacteria bacterium]|nr:aminopeptidase P family protein [Actinomycetota bacterium]